MCTCTCGCVCARAASTTRQQQQRIPRSIVTAAAAAAQAAAEADPATVIMHGPGTDGHRVERSSQLEEWARARLEEIHEKERSGGAPRRGRKLVVLLHGLESSSTQPLTKRFAQVFSRRGYDVAAVNFRGCSGEYGAQPLGYHLGFTDDLEFVLAEVRRRWPGLWDRIYLTGFSLGANVVINFLGKQGRDAAVKHGVYGAAVGCAPFDPQASVAQLESTRVGQVLYVPSFMNILLAKAAAHIKLYPSAFDPDSLSKIKTFSDFNEHIILPLYGFRTMEDYYNTVDARQYISKVEVPLLVVNARDDPLISEDSLPDPKEVGDAPVQLIYHDKGGHCGFLKSAKNSQTEGRWLPTELARFLDHVDEQLGVVDTSCETAAAAAAAAC